MNKKDVTQLVLNSISKATHINTNMLNYNEPFENYGIESAMMISIIRDLENSLGELPKTLFFEYNNISELLEYLFKNYCNVKNTYDENKNPVVDINFISTPNMNDNIENKIKKNISEDADLTINFNEILQKNTFDNKLTENPTVTNESDIAIIGMSGKFPMANNLDEFWENLINCKDCIEEIPNKLWNWEDYWNPNKGVKGKSYSKWGGFIKDSDKFDPLFFNISNLEANMLDPQERKFLEVVYHTLENAGYTSRSLSDKSVGVYVGVMWGQYQLFGEKYADAQSSYSSIANRISYFFDFNGPCLALDTMCSSSLTSLHLACESIKSGECDLAIAGGVNLTVHPNKYIYLSKTGFAASDGKCRSFGDGGDGYVPGDGVGAFLLKPLNKAIYDKDNIWGIIKSTSINHGGKSKGFTVPNPKAQTKLVEAGLKKAKISPKELSYLELHGTGTALGDPIELRALYNAFKNLGLPTDKIPIGSVKSNIGHLESAAGFASIAKVLLEMKNSTLVPSIHSSKLNTNINFDELPFYVQKNIDKWENPRKLASVSSFGAGGSNAYVVLENYQSISIKKEKLNTPYYILLSAKTEEQLRQKINDLYLFLNTKYSLGKIKNEVIKRKDSFYKSIINNSLISEDLISKDDDLSIINFIDNKKNNFLIEKNNCKTINELIRLKEKYILDELMEADHESIISNLSYTLQVGRENMKFKTYFKVFTLAELFIQLEKIVIDKEQFPIFVGKKTKTLSETENNFIENLITSKNMPRLIDLWIKNYDFSFSSFYKNDDVRKISLPEYPFAQERCWHKSLSNNASQNDKLNRLFNLFNLYKSVEFNNINLYSVLSNIENLNLSKDEDTISLTSNNIVIAKGKLTNKNISSDDTINIFKHYSDFKLGEIDEIEQIKINNNEKLIIANKYFSDNFLLSTIKSLFRSESILHLKLGNVFDNIKYIYIISNEVSNKLILFSNKKDVVFSIEIYFETNLKGKLFLPKWNVTNKYLLKVPTQNNIIYIFDSSISHLIKLNSNSTYIELGEINEKREKNYFCIKYDNIENLLNLSNLNLNNKIYYLGFNISKFDETNIDPSIYSRYILPFWKFIKLLGENTLDVDITLITNNCRKILTNDLINPISSLLIGIGKSSSKEFSNITFNVLDLDIYNDEFKFNDLSSLNLKDFNDISIRNNLIYERSFEELNEFKINGINLIEQNVIVLVGGSGTVGKQITKYISDIKTEKTKVIWIGRRPMDDTIKNILKPYKNLVTYYQSDVTDYEKMLNIFSDIISKHKEINIIMNLAMDFSIRRLNNIDSNYIKNKLEAKVTGNLNLYKLSKKYAIKNLIFFSSGEAFTCNSGWGVYASSCIFTDSLMEYINSSSIINCISINWGFWENDNESLNKQFISKGIIPLNYKNGGKALEKILSSDFKQMLVLDVNDNVKEKMGIINTKFNSTSKIPANNNDIIIDLNKNFDNINSIAIKLKDIFSNVLKIDNNKISVEEDLATYGVDSLLITELHQSIKESFGDIPASVILTGPTITDIAKYIFSQTKYVNLINKVDSHSVEKYLRDYTKSFDDNLFTTKSVLQFDNIIEEAKNQLIHFSLLINSKKIEIMIYGTGKPILFLPALGLAAPSFIKQFLSLYKKYQIIVIHIPGYGLSDIVTNAKTKEIGEILIECIKQLKIDEKISVISSCFGSIVGTYLAYKFPDLVSSLTLVGGFYDNSDLPKIDNENLTVTELTKMTNLISSSITKDFDKLKTLPNTDIDLIEDSKNILLNSKCSNPLVAIRYMNEMLTLNTSEWIKKIKLPILCIYGDNDTIISPKNSHIIHELAQNSYIYELKNSGHYPYLTNEKEFNEIITKFISEVK